jgi:hypothetical protein
MVFLEIVIIELVLLFFSSFLLIPQLVKKLYKLTKSKTATIHILFYLLLPGILLHELSHALFSAMLFVPMGRIKFYPEITEEGLHLGSLEIAETDPLRRFLIGISPMITGVLLILTILYGFTNQALFVSSVMPGFVFKIILIYFIFVIVNTMASSKKDLEGAGGLLLTALLFFAIFYFFGGRIDVGFVEKQSLLFKNAAFYLLMPLLINFGAYLGLRLKN